MDVAAVDVRLAVVVVLVAKEPRAVREPDRDLDVEDEAAAAAAAAEEKEEMFLRVFRALCGRCLFLAVIVAGVAAAAAAAVALNRINGVAVSFSFFAARCFRTTA